MKVVVVGTGYVGLVTGACFADLGNEIICVDNDENKVKILKEGGIPIYEPGLEEIVKRNSANKRLTFSSDLKSSVKEAEIVFICVGTPPKNDGSADLSGIEAVSREVAEAMDGYKLLVEKSTVPVETGEWVKKTVNTFKKKDAEFDVASNPEFLREGTAIEDFMNPDRVVIGVESERAEKLLKDLYEPLDTKIVVTNIKGAEIIKHASNSFLATKISFANALSNICDKVGADVKSVTEGIGMDSRINKYFLNAGIGFGGSCFPKDLKAFIHIADKLGYDFSMLKEVEKINDRQKDFAVKKITDMLWNLEGKTIAVWGLAFKPDTDDIREAPAIDIIKKLISLGAKVRAFDPVAMDNTKREVSEKVTYCGDIYQAAEGADIVVLMTEWNEFKEVDWEKIKSSMVHPVVLDGRNIYDPAKLKALGFKYSGIGRS